MPKQKLKDESYQVVSRGLVPHLKYMSNAQAKLYLYCLLSAPNIGENRGVVRGFVADMAKDLDWDFSWFYRVLNSCDEYLEVLLSGNRHKPIEIHIKKFKSVKDFYSGGDNQSNDQGNSQGNDQGKTAHDGDDDQSNESTLAEPRTLIQGKAKVTAPNPLENQPLKNANKVKKIKKKEYSRQSLEYRAATYFFSLILKRNSEHKPPDLQKWSNEIDLMIRVDKREPKAMRRLMDWCQNNEFWQNNILSIKKFRAQYDQLLLKSGELRNAPEESMSSDELYQKNQEEQQQIEKELEEDPVTEEDWRKLNQSLRTLHKGFNFPE
jgi:hypothetical protein